MEGFTIMFVNELDTDNVLDSNSSRLQLLRMLAEFYTVSTGVDWTEVAGAMPKIKDDPIGNKYLVFLALFEYWLTFDRFNLNINREKKEFCRRAKILLRFKDFFKLSLGTLEYVYEHNCEDVDGESR